MLNTIELERIAYITNNAPALQLCEELDCTQADLDNALATIETLEAKVKNLEDDVIMLGLGYETNGTKQPENDQSARVAQLEKIIARTVFNLRENGHMTKKQQLNLADYLAQA